MIIVIADFSIVPGNEARYVSINERLEHALRKCDGFLACERYQHFVFRNKLLSVTTWTDEAALASWQASAPFMVAMAETEIFAHYRVRIAKVVLALGSADRVDVR